MAFTLIIPPEMPCGCGSGRPFGECHLRNNSVDFPAVEPIPPPPRTGQQIKKCYLKSTYDCGAPISAEHMISQTVLTEISDTKITFNAQAMSFSARPSAHAFAVKVLCKRHNSALHRLDTELGRFTRDLKYIYRCQQAGQYAGVRYFFLFNGHDIERAMLKMLIAMSHHKLQRGLRLPHGIENWLFTSDWPRGAGLYVLPHHKGDREKAFATRNEVSLAVRHQEQTIYGMDFTLFGFPFMLLLTHPALARGDWTNLTFRPASITFFRGTELFVMALAWSGNDEHGQVMIAPSPDEPIPDGILPGAFSATD
jgi:hypothetical protein